MASSPLPAAPPRCLSIANPNGPPSPLVTPKSPCHLSSHHLRPYQIEPYIASDDFTPESVAKVSRACTSICMWVRAMHAYHLVALAVAPKRAALAAARAALDATLAGLAGARARLADVEARVAALEAAFGAAEARAAALAAQAEDCRARLARADRLIGGLGGERARWQVRCCLEHCGKWRGAQVGALIVFASRCQGLLTPMLLLCPSSLHQIIKATVAELEEALANLEGDTLLAAAAVAYSGPFTPAYRAALKADWSAALKANGVRSTPGGSLAAALGVEPPQLRAWAAAGLPAGAASEENALIALKARRWPLMIDPQGQAGRWVRAMERDAGLEVVAAAPARDAGLEVVAAAPARDALRAIENALRFGRPLLLEGVGEALDAALAPLLARGRPSDAIGIGGGVGGAARAEASPVRLGDAVVACHGGFRLYMTTALANPDYAPEVTASAALLNFAATPEGLEDQLLGVAVERVRLFLLARGVVAAGLERLCTVLLLCLLSCLPFSIPNDKRTNHHPQKQQPTPSDRSARTCRRSRPSSPSATRACAPTSRPQRTAS